MWRQWSILGGVISMILSSLYFLYNLHSSSTTDIADKFDELATAFFLFSFSIFITLIFFLLDISEKIYKQFKSQQESLTKFTTVVNETLENSKSLINESLASLQKTIENTTCIKSDSWLQDFMPKLANIIDQAKCKDNHRYTAVTTYFENTHNEVLKQLADTERPVIFNYSRNKELSRMNLLATVVEDAAKHVRAVTLDSGNYLLDFWQGKFSEDFSELNAKQHVVVERIFVIGRDVINGDNKEKCKLMTNLLKFHLERGIDVRVVGKDKLPSDEKLNTSFMICDNIICSESYSLDSDDKLENDKKIIDGYVAYYDENRYSRLNRIFTKLKSLTDENWMKSSLNRIQG